MFYINPAIRLRYWYIANLSDWALGPVQFDVRLLIPDLFCLFRLQPFQQIFMKTLRSDNSVYIWHPGLFAMIVSNEVYAL